MPKVYKPKEIIAKLKKLGFEEDRQSGSHKIFYHPKTGNRSVVPYHLKEIPKGTFTSMLKESKISKEEFENA